MPQIVVITGGGPLDRRAVSGIEADAPVIAADSGLDHALAAGIEPTVLVGDLDSVSDAGRQWAETSRIAIHRHPPDKDATDTELAVAMAAAAGPDRLLLLAGPGDRLDHTLGTLGVLGSAVTHPFAKVKAWIGGTRIDVARPGRGVHLHEPPATTFSVLALHGPCHGVTITGATWPLTAASLEPGISRGISNTTLAEVTVQVTSGTLTVIIP